jgi:predicted MFS family arabinose efflux permease
MFLGIAVFMTVIGIVYWFASYEPAGTTMLALSAALAAVCGVYLRIQDEASDTRVHDTAQYLPESSAWPFGIGAGAWLSVNGMIVGFGYAIPGLVVLALSVAGLIAQSRRRA